MGGWVAQGLEVNIAAQGTSPELAFRSFVRAYRAQVHIDRVNGREPLSSTGQAPRKYWEIFERVANASTNLQTSPVATEDEGVPPAYVIKAICNDPLITAEQ